MRAAQVLMSVLAAQAVQIGVESGAESELESLEKLTVDGVQDGQRVLIMVLKALDKFANKVEEEDAEDSKQCACRQKFMENELQDLCGSETIDDTTVNKCGDGDSDTAGFQDGMVAGYLIPAAETAVTQAQTTLETALAAQAGAAENSRRFQQWMETTMQQTNQDEATQNKRLEEIHRKMEDMQVLAKAINRAILTLAQYGTDGVSGRPQTLNPGFTIGTPYGFIQLKQDVQAVKEQSVDNQYAEALEKQLLAFEVAAGVNQEEVHPRKKEKVEEKKEEALVQEGAPNNPARLYLMNDRSDMLLGYLRTLYEEITKDIKETQAGLAMWQDATSRASSPRDKAIDEVFARMSGGAAYALDDEGTSTGNNHMVGFRRLEIKHANEAAEARRDLAAKQSQLDMMRQYMRETQMNQVIETQACRSRKDERADELKAINDAKTLLEAWRGSEWEALVQTSETPASFIQMDAAASTETEAEAGAAAAFDTLKALREDFEVYRAQMQSALNTLNGDWKECKRDIKHNDEELEKTTLELGQVQALKNEQQAIMNQMEAAETQLSTQITEAESKAEQAATKRDAQRTANRKEAEACESSVAVTHKVIEILKAHFQNGAATSANETSGSTYGDATRAAQRNDDDGDPATDDGSRAARGIQHNERTSEITAIISSLQNVAAEFEKCGQTVRATDRKEENAFRRGQQDMMKLIQDLSVEKAYATGQLSVATSRYSQLQGDFSQAQTGYQTARDNTRNDAYKNCKEAIATFDGERDKLMQKIENAIAVKDLIMVAMQNIKGVPAYPMDCTLTDADQDGSADSSVSCDATACTETMVYTVATGKTIDGSDTACDMSATCTSFGGQWTCDTAMTGAECTCEIDLTGGVCSVDNNISCSDPLG